jgi:hypothetical protein
MVNELAQFEGKSALNEPEIHLLVGRLSASRNRSHEPSFRPKSFRANLYLKILNKTSTKK